MRLGVQLPEPQSHENAGQLGRKPYDDKSLPDFLHPRQFCIRQRSELGLHLILSPEGLPNRPLTLNLRSGQNTFRGIDIVPLATCKCKQHRNTREDRLRTFFLVLTSASNLYPLAMLNLDCTCILVCSIICRPYAVVLDEISRHGSLPTVAPVKPYTELADTWHHASMYVRFGM